MSPVTSPSGLAGQAPDGRASAAAGPPGPPRTPHPDEGRHQLDLLPLHPIRVGDVPVQVWVADTYERRRLGLMHVRALPDDRGMLFVYPDVDRRAFWMQNTLIPLSLAYVGADGRIHEVVDMKALDESTYPSRQAARFGLEMRLGWFDDHGVRPGARIEGITQLVGYP